jgi:FkbM family methyltransferase
MTTAAAHAEAVESPRGVPGHIYVRDGTSDLSLVLGHFSIPWAAGDDEYGLRDLTVRGVFVDVGAHIGSVALAVLLDNPDATAILVEPLPENMALARETMSDNGLSDRVTFVTAAVGSAKVRYGAEDVDDRFVGNIGTHDGQTITAEVVTLPQLVAMAGGRIAAMKVDCEGGEWGLLRSTAVRHVDLIFGEWHGNTSHRDGRARLDALLGKTHELVSVTDVGGIGLFRAVRR